MLYYAIKIWWSVKTFRSIVWNGT